MTDLDIAVSQLVGHSICLCKDGSFFTDDGRGISPMMRLIAEEKDLAGYSAADVIVGKAAAMLFVKAGIVCVFGKTVSRSGLDYLTEHSIPCTYETLTASIINRQGTGICPMEDAVLEISDCEAGYTALKRRMEELRRLH
ncbi:MAG: DUF1893 domain-containing protein [Oscillospiraceae bacterium]|nr:DUF1893 domain-containing protein [Oscillospiraceae bacterium]